MPIPRGSKKTYTWCLLIFLKHKNCKWLTQNWKHICTKTSERENRKDCIGTAKARIIVILRLCSNIDFILPHYESSINLPHWHPCKKSHFLSWELQPVKKQIIAPIHATIALDTVLKINQGFWVPGEHRFGNIVVETYKLLTSRCDTCLNLIISNHIFQHLSTTTVICPLVSPSFFGFRFCISGKRVYLLLQFQHHFIRGWCNLQKCQHINSPHPPPRASPKVGL